MKALYILATAALLGCSEMASSAGSAAECDFGYSNMPSCMFDGYKVAIQRSRLAVDEIQLKAVLVSYRGKQQRLELSPDTSMLDDDKGVVLFDDINFDGIPDLAISTSFGLANQYMDYWIFDNREGPIIKSRKLCPVYLAPIR